MFGFMRRHRRELLNQSSQDQVKPDKPKSPLSELKSMLDRCWSCLEDEWHLRGSDVNDLINKNITLYHNGEVYLCADLNDPENVDNIINANTIIEICKNKVKLFDIGDLPKIDILNSSLREYVIHKELGFAIKSEICPHAYIPSIDSTISFRTKSELIDDYYIENRYKTTYMSLRGYEYDGLSDKLCFNILRAISPRIKSIEDLIGCESVSDLNDVWFEEKFNTRVHERAHRDVIIKEVMTKVIDSVSRYNSLAIRSNIMGIAPIKNFTSYETACNILNMQVLLKDYEVDNYLRNLNAYSGEH